MARHGPGRALKHGHVAHLYLFQRLCPGDGADVQIQILHLDVVPAAGQGLCPLPGTENAGKAVREHHPVIDDLGGVVPALVGYREETPLVNTCDHEADGVHMGAQHDLFSLALFMADQIAHGVGGDGVHIGGGHLLQHLCDTVLLPARGPGGGHQGLMELQHIKHPVHLLPQ